MIAAQCVTGLLIVAAVSCNCITSLAVLGGRTLYAVGIFCACAAGVMMLYIIRTLRAIPRWTRATYLRLRRRRMAGLTSSCSHPSSTGERCRMKWLTFPRNI